MKLSKNEAALVKLIPANGSKTDTAKLAKAFFGRRQPLNARVRITNLVRSIMAKGKARRDIGIPLIKRSARSGPKAIQVWRVK